LELPGCRQDFFTPLYSLSPYTQKNHMMKNQGFFVFYQRGVNNMLFFPPRKPGPAPAPKAKRKPWPGVPILKGFPGLQLNLNVNHMQLLGTLALMGLSSRPGFKEDMQQIMQFLQQAQAAAEAISAQVESMQAEFDKVKTRMAERQSSSPPRPEANPYVNPFIQQLLKFL